MSYRLKFLPAALKEWRKLPPPIRAQFKNKLRQRLEIPKAPADQLRGYQNIYKIKLRSSGYRLAYEVFDTEIVVVVLAVSKRDKSKVYKNLGHRKKP